MMNDSRMAMVVRLRSFRYTLEDASVRRPKEPRNIAHEIRLSTAELSGTYEAGRLRGTAHLHEINH